ncbi:MAG: TIGR03960 family B12-binding radical SAM protein [Cyanobacteria bacterium]|nr:TIGR03960 family B12-binding radical SAM protein [Cyanobacteria bacterium CG_2015-16_32_12]NCO79316.1 TIGR03960 family B12-binding radical SAM protein [Cyanobacteria bacterium CG_2015-22_32_23]NCQ05036.1 TIGR03960 family B12-binding radical SAM protein [Cyanobacteria bacterium CG_2015-09_32_10]NCQ41340.1 TIGR03960 family B12-binding radical SAM protein [Cyanobacteria bacterium CG_2015-04_32_10]NCS84052.1 TIGR03960 family B12-binding radical SAM protein [Cyanobacteria bacterium CG_2015-02_32_
MVIATDKLITPEIFKPARYLGNELGAKHKEWQSAEVRWVLTYPEIYEVGASNLGHIILYNIINDQPTQLCDRSYLPAADLAKKMRDTNTPLFALESKRDVKEFDILGFSLSYELGATNILEMLSLAHIPLTWQERKDRDYPLIFAGGQTATSNPEPYADFFDFVALGDGEELLPEIGLVIEKGKKEGLTKTQLLWNLAQVPGVYVPQFYDMQEDGSVKANREDVPERILRRVATPIPHYSIGLVPYVQTVHDRLTIEIRRGCTRGCRFCQPGMLTRPARDVEPKEVVESIVEGMKQTGFNEFSLLSLSCSDYLSLPAVGIEIKNRLKDENISLSLPSQRVDRFDENIANIIGGTRKGGLTFAPEAGTQRMRNIINKGLTDEELLRGIQTAVKEGWNQIKLYFMIGLPGETDEDVIGIVETIKWLRQECRHLSNKRLNFNVTISNFTPKPHTPFQWHSVSTSEFLRKRNILRDEFYPVKGVKVNYTDVRISAIEDFVGRGDRRLAPVVRRAWELGAGMDSWWENIDKAYKAWQQAIDEAGLTWKYRQVENGEWNVFETLTPLNPPLEGGKSEKSKTPSLVEERVGERLYNMALPWDHLDTGIDKNWLKNDLEKALQEATVPDCAFDGCSHCGVCSPDFGHNIVVTPPPIPDYVGDFKPNQEKAQKIRVWFGKHGDMALVSHLDLVRLFDRAIRRASIPISYTGGFHPGPKISIALALSLGMTSNGEIVDFENHTYMDINEFTEKLKAQLPPELPIFKVEELPLKSPKATQILDTAEYIITVSADNKFSVTQWQNWLNQVQNSSEIIMEKTAKTGKKKMVNLRENLDKISLIDDNFQESDTVTINYLGSAKNDGSLLTPDQVCFMLEQISGENLSIIKAHREEIILADIITQ